MNENNFQSLLNEIDSMSIEEYNNFHEEALKMKNSGFSTKVSDKEYITSDEQDLNFINKDEAWANYDYLKKYKELPKLEGDLHIFWKKFHEEFD